MLAITYAVVFCACIACWRGWQRCLFLIEIGASARRLLVYSYWLMTFGVLADLIESLRLLNDNLTHVQLRNLLLLAVGTIPQVVLVAFVVTPVLMRCDSKKRSFAKAVMFMETSALISIIILIASFICLMGPH